MADRSAAFKQRSGKRTSFLSPLEISSSRKRTTSSGRFRGSRLGVKLQHFISDVHRLHAAVHRVLTVQFSHAFVTSCSVALASRHTPEDLQSSVPLGQSLLQQVKQPCTFSPCGVAGANSLAGSRWAQTNTAAVLPQTASSVKANQLDSTSRKRWNSSSSRILPCFISPWLMRGRGGRYFSALPPKLEEPPEVTTLAGTLGGATGDPVGAGTVAPEPLPALAAAKGSADTVRRASSAFRLASSSSKPTVQKSQLSTLSLHQKVHLILLLLQCCVLVVQHLQHQLLQLVRTQSGRRRNRKLNRCTRWRTSTPWHLCCRRRRLGRGTPRTWSEQVEVHLLRHRRAVWRTCSTSLLARARPWRFTAPGLSSGAPLPCEKQSA